jgi:phage replication initiation protein
MKNECLIDWLRFSIPYTTENHVAENILALDATKFTQERKNSPYPTYNSKVTFANIEIHSSINHEKILVNLSGQACRQYEEYMSAIDGWHWHEFIKVILHNNGNITRIDLALDIYDDSSPSVKKLQDYVKRGQLSTRSHTFKEINSGQILDGKLKGFTLYIGATPQMLRIYDKKQERIDNTGEIANVKKWVRWELELTDKKAMKVARLITSATPLNIIIRGILSAHYSFKTQPKSEKNFHNKARWSNMKWWNNFIENIPQMPLKVVKDKPTMEETAKWLNHGVSKSLAMQHQALIDAYGEDYANEYIRKLLENGTSKFSEKDEYIIEQRVHELIGSDTYE